MGVILLGWVVPAGVGLWLGFGTAAPWWFALGVAVILTYVLVDFADELMKAVGGAASPGAIGFFLALLAAAIGACAADIGWGWRLVFLVLFTLAWAALSMPIRRRRDERVGLEAEGF